MENSLASFEEEAEKQLQTVGREAERLRRQTQELRCHIQLGQRLRQLSAILEEQVDWGGACVEGRSFVLGWSCGAGSRWPEPGSSGVSLDETPESHRVRPSVGARFHLGLAFVGWSLAGRGFRRGEVTLVHTCPPDTLPFSLFSFCLVLVWFLGHTR